MIQITDNQYNSLVNKIYDSLISMPDMGMGEMGSCRDEAARIVDEWMQENKISLPVDNPLCTTTKSAELKTKVLQVSRQLLTDYENDIESGISDGTYEEEENIDTRKFIAEAKELFTQFENDVIEVLVYVEGGTIQGASATHPLEFTVFDKDNFNAGGQQFVEIFGTPEQWDKLIKDRTEAKDITPVF